MAQKRYSMKEACQILGMPYETLKYYCKEGLVPGVQRDRSNYRVFDERSIGWIKGLQSLRDCGMSMKEMKHYLQLCLEGARSIPERKDILAQKRLALQQRFAQVEQAIQYIDDKQAFYDGVLEGRIAYVSNLLDAPDDAGQDAS